MFVVLISEATELATSTLVGLDKLCMSALEGAAEGLLVFLFCQWKIWL